MWSVILRMSHLSGGHSGLRASDWKSSATNCRQSAGRHYCNSWPLLGCYLSRSTDRLIQSHSVTQCFALISHFTIKQRTLSASVGCCSTDSMAPGLAFSSSPALHPFTTLNDQRKLTTELCVCSDLSVTGT